MNICTCCKKNKKLSDFGKDKRYNKPQTQCKKCLVIKRKKYYKDNPLKANERLEKRKEYSIKIRKIMKYKRLNNKTIFEKRDKAYYEKNKEKTKRRSQKDSENLTDKYIKKLITKITKLKCDEITPELIELKRVQIQLKREIKNESTNTQRTT